MDDLFNPSGRNMINSRKRLGPRPAPFDARSAAADRDAAKCCRSPGSPSRPQTLESPASTEPKPRKAPKIRVGFFTPNFLLGGAEYWILGLLRHLDREIFAFGGVAMASTAPSDPEISRDAAAIAHIYGGPLYDCPADQAPDRGLVRRCPSAQDALAKVVADSDVLIVWGTANLRGHLSGLDFPGPIVLVSHGCGQWTEQMLCGSESAASHLVGVSEAAAASFRSKRAIVLHNGGDDARCRVTQPPGETRRQWGAAPTDKLIGYVGRFSWEKNPLAAARAARQLGPPYRAVYVGSGWKEHEVKPAVRRIAPDAIFSPPIKQVGNAFAALDAFMLASPSEGFSLSLTEAWLCGLPTVATRVGAVPELEHKHGRLVVPISVDATDEELARAALHALSEENRVIVHRAQAIAQRHYTVAAMANRWKDFLLRIYQPNRLAPH